MTRGQENAIGERVAVVETKIDGMDAAIKDMAAKIDRILEGQVEGKQDHAEGRQDRAELRAAVESLQADVKSMRPDVETVKDAKKIMRFGAWIGGAIGAVVAASWAMWSWVIQHLTWR